MSSIKIKPWILVTGAGSGIGQKLTIKLAGSHNVLAVGRREQKLLETKNLCGKNSENIAVLSADISTEEGRNAIWKHFDDRRKQLDDKKSLTPASLAAVVHNAAVIEPIKKMMDLNVDEFSKAFRINVEAPLFLLQKLYPFLKSYKNEAEEYKFQLKKGRVLHISSGAAHKSLEGWGTYCLSKSAFFSMYETLKQELREEISVGSVRPGVVDTPMQQTIRKQGIDTFPNVPYFKSLYENNELLSADKVAEHLEHLLLKTDDESFCEKEWDVREM